MVCQIICVTIFDRILRRSWAKSVDVIKFLAKIEFLAKPSGHENPTSGKGEWYRGAVPDLGSRQKLHRATSPRPRVRAAALLFVTMGSSFRMQAKAGLARDTAGVGSETLRSLSEFDFCLLISLTIASFFSRRWSSTFSLCPAKFLLHKQELFPDTYIFLILVFN